MKSFLFALFFSSIKTSKIPTFIVKKEYTGHLLGKRSVLHTLRKPIEYLETKQQGATRKWIGEGKAVAMLDGISKSTLQRILNNGEIGFTQPNRKIILYISTLNK